MIKSFCRYTAVEQPDHLDQFARSRDPTEERPGHRYRTLERERGEGAARRTRHDRRRAVRDTVLLSLAYDTAARVQGELCDLDVADIRHTSQMTVVIHGKGSKIRYVPVMGPTAQLVADYLERRKPHPGLGAERTQCFTDRTTAG